MGISKAKPTEYNCMGCGKTFIASPSLAGKRKYCSVICRFEHQAHKINCEVCGKERAVSPTQLKLNARFCSVKCASLILNKPGIRHKVSCELCGKISEVLPSRVKQGIRFCSHSCRSIFNLTHGAFISPTSIELILYKTLEVLKVKFEKQYPMPQAGTIPDAYIPSLNLVLYADGDYWHTLPKQAKRDKVQDKRLAELGYKVCRFSEKDLKNNPLKIIKAALLAQVNRP